MARLHLLALFIALISCSSPSPQMRQATLEEWKGRAATDLMDHPYFKYLPLNKKKHDGGEETWIFRDQGRYQSAAYCQSLGGCMGIPYYNCDTAFSIKDKMIQSVDQSGSCPPSRVTEALKK